MAIAQIIKRSAEKLPSSHTGAGAPVTAAPVSPAAAAIIPEEQAGVVAPACCAAALAARAAQRVR
jgi:hypothetical protein